MYCKQPISTGIEDLPWLRIYCSQHFSQMEKFELNEIDFSQGYSQKVVSTSCFYFDFLPARGDFCCLLIHVSLQTVWTQIRPDKMSSLIWIQCFDTGMVLKKFSIQRVIYVTIVKCEGIIKAIFENPKADQNTLFCKYVIFEPLYIFRSKWLQW